MSLRVAWSLLLYLTICSPCTMLSAQQSKSLFTAQPDSSELTGTWDCDGSFRSGKPHKSTFKGSMILANSWLELDEADVEPATGYVAKYLIGYDTQHKQILEFGANNFGAATYTSVEGWKDHVLTMTSPTSQEQGSPYAANRFLYSATDQNTFSADWQISRTVKLNWLPADHLVCKRRV